MDQPCANCGTTNPDDARFCMSCGSPLASPGEPSQERRVVSVLFADLVGFTERSDAADPEDVRRTLVPFHTRAKEAIERYGGTLDKFIGDAAMGVFGAPLAHDNDPERAVLAGLDLLGSLDGLRRTDPGIAIRVAITTGEAVVSFGSGPRIGEAVAGDVVNTASRLQSVAPRDGLVIGEDTWRAVSGRFDMEEGDPVRVKGKAAPLRLWRVLGGAEAGPGTPTVELVGRASELAALEEMVDRVRERGSAELVTVLGEPGLGKTRLLSELRARTSAEAHWLTGSCVPYGEDATLRPLAELVRSVAGAEHGGDQEVAARRVEALAARIEPEPAERAWLTARLGGLIGLDPGDDVDRSPVPASESAAACARVLSHAAEAAPVVVAIEDLHWGEPALREAIALALDELAASPVAIVCTARPELIEGGDWIDERATVSTLRLSELKDAETRELLDRLTIRHEVPSDLREVVAGRSGGNPLFAVEYVRMLVEAPGAADAGSVPTSVTAVVAARLDVLPAGHRALLQDAAVFGTAFWPEGLRALSDRTQPGDDVLDDLVRRGTIVPTPSSRLTGQPEFGFAHALFREVSYGRLPRSVRARKHRDAGAWLVSVAGERTTEIADMLANHFATAAEQATAAGDPDLVATVRDQALHWLFAAGEAAIRVDEGGAFTLFQRARVLAIEGTPDHAHATARMAWLGRRAGTLTGEEVLERLEESVAAERALGDPSRIGGVLVRLAQQLGVMGDAERARSVFEEATGILEAHPAGSDLARAYAFQAEEEMFAGHLDASLELAERGLSLARAAGADDIQVIALHVRGDGRCSAGDIGGLEDLEQALAIAEAAGVASDIVISLTYIGEWRWLLQGPAVGVPDYERAIAIAAHRGAVNQGVQARVAVLPALVELGRWDRVLSWTDELLEAPERLDPPWLVTTRCIRAGILDARGAPADDEPGELLERARPTGEVQVIALAATTAARLAIGRDDPEGARAFLEEFDRVTRDVVPTYRATNATAALRVCADLGDVELAARIVDPMVVVTPVEQLYVNSARSIVTEMRGGSDPAARAFADVERRWRTLGCGFEAAAAAFGRGRCLRALGRDDVAVAPFAAARQGFAELGAQRWVDRVDAAAL